MNIRRPLLWLSLWLSWALSACVPVSLGELEDSPVPITPTPAPDLDGDGFAPFEGDCDDQDPTRFPDAPEQCDQKDNDCNGLTDDGPEQEGFVDLDGDGFGTEAVTVSACEPTPAEQPGDCNDDDPAISPAALDVCDGLDNNCNGDTDEGALLTYYPDNDEDGYGRSDALSEGCTVPTGSVLVGGDCDDDNSKVYPDASEICDELDNNCNGDTDEGVQILFYPDSDQDKYGDSRHPGVAACKGLTSTIANNLDCDDSRSDIFPNAPELCDDRDNNCNTLIDETLPLLTSYPDTDDDGFGEAGAQALEKCNIPPENASVEGDCDDLDPTVYPEAPEECDGLDNNCDLQVDEPEDLDLDGVRRCDADSGETLDCDDRNPTVYPEAPEEVNDKLDSNCNGQQDHMRTYAGTGDNTFTSDGVPALSSALNAPSELRFGPDGALYIADSQNHRIRRIGLDGIISTVAGNGTATFAGDNGPAIQASLNLPNGVVFDGSGHLYIADSLNNRIRKVNPAGIITTYAGQGIGYAGDGGSAASARFITPLGLGITAEPALLISDSGNNRVRKIRLNDDQVSTVAGNGSRSYGGDGQEATRAALNLPSAVAVLDDGGFFIADSGNNRVRYVNASGVISTFAGTGATPQGGEIGDGGPATSARLGTPICLILDPFDNLYVAERSGNRIRKISSAQLIETVAGNGSAGYTGDDGSSVYATLSTPQAVTVDALGMLYVSDAGNHRVRWVEF
ncbi:MAG: MopE-related protein [Myxococcota bacterium]